MYKVAKSDKDTYITSKYIQKKLVTGSNVGIAASLDLYKLYGNTYTGNTPNTELSRLLIHFDLKELKNLHAENKIDVSDSSFWCKLSLKDVYAGQTTPSNFKVSVFPLSASFNEGVGKDVVYYTDRDVANWKYSDYGVEWYGVGCTGDCLDDTPGDYIIKYKSLGSTESTQTFKTGAEDLLVDVTKIVSATVVGVLPDSGFRVSLTSSLESNSQTYFVKRFGSRHAYNTLKHPRLIYGFDDSVSDDSQNLVFDTDSSVNLYNYVAGESANIVSASYDIVGSDSLLLKLVTSISGGFYEDYFTGSQLTLGINPVTGVYTATVNVPSDDPDIAQKLEMSGSVSFTPYWKSLDDSVCYATGSTLTFRRPERTSKSSKSRSYVVTVTGLKSIEPKNSETSVRVNIFDYSSPLIQVVRVPVEMPGIVLKNVYYSVRDVSTGEQVIPFDFDKNSTKVSSDSDGMFFILDTSVLEPGRTYVIDVAVKINGMTQKFVDCSPTFRVEE